MVEFPTQLFDTFTVVNECIDFYLSIIHDIHIYMQYILAIWLEVFS